MRHMYLFGGAIGDALLGIHLAHILHTVDPEAEMLLVSTRSNQFVRDLVTSQQRPYLAYQELDKRWMSSWIRLATFTLHQWNTVVYEPVTVRTPVWWRVILCATAIRGGIHVRYRMRRFDMKTTTPWRVVVLDYDCKTENLFATTEDVIRAWHKPSPHGLIPSLFVPSGTTPQGAYVVFHFFAAQYRRSIPQEQARAILLEARRAFPDEEFILTCEPKELSAAKQILDGVNRTHVIAGLPAADLLRTLKGARAVVGTASGVIHMAAQVSGRVVALCNLSDPCWLPTYNPAVTILAERARCGCNGDKTGVCAAETPAGPVFRCLHDIKTEQVIKALREKLG